MPTVEELQNEIAALRAEREQADTPTSQPLSNGGADAPISTAPQSTPRPGKPELSAIFLKERALQTTVGVIALEPSELKKIHKIAARAFKRAMADLVSAVSERPSRGPKPVKVKTKIKAKNGRRKKAASPKVSKSGKRLGRPPKARTVTHETPTVAAEPSFE